MTTDPIWQGPVDDCHAEWEGYILTYGDDDDGWHWQASRGSGPVIGSGRCQTGAEARAAAKWAAREDKETR